MKRYRNVKLDTGYDEEEYYEDDMDMEMDLEEIGASEDTEPSEANPEETLEPEEDFVSVTEE